MGATLVIVLRWAGDPGGGEACAGYFIPVRGGAITLRTLSGERMLSAWKNAHSRSSSKKSNASPYG